MMSDDAIRRKYGFTQDEIHLLHKIIKKPKREPSKSEFLKKAENPLSIHDRCLKAIVDRHIGPDGMIPLLDGIPLKDCGPQVQKAYVIQEMINARWVWNTDDTLTPSHKRIVDLSDFDNDGMEFSENFKPAISRDEATRLRKIPKPVGKNEKVANPWIV